MKKLFLICCLFLLSTKAQAENIFHTYPLKTGTYELRGSNSPSGNLDYSGEVVINKQGNNYALCWKIDGEDSQVGVGILHKNILSVSYIDTIQNRVGVMSFVITSEEELEGKWAGLLDKYYGREYLVWKSN